MQTILIGDLVVPADRQRTTTDPLKFEELKQSILSEGLFHAVILTEENSLVSGATRLKAIAEIYLTGVPIFYDGKEVPFGHVPFTFTHKTDEFSLWKIELEENLRREQLSPQDEAQALAKLHGFLQANAPELLPGFKAQVTLKETATELGKITGEPKTTDPQRVADAILIDQWKDHPDVKRAKTMKEAARAAKKAAERQFREVLGGMKVENETSKHKLLVGDCAERMKEISDGVVDVIIADPPYGIGADEFGEQSKVGHGYKDDWNAFETVFKAIRDNANRICKPDAAMFIFMDITVWSSAVHTAAALSDGDLFPGWYIWPTPLIWYKPNRGHAPQPKRGPSRRYEAILYAIRGSREVRKTGSDVLSFNVPDDRSHGAGKPAALYAELCSWIAYPGDLILDPCAGSGTVIEAADGLSCSAIAIEQDEASITMIREKMK